MAPQPRGDDARHAHQDPPAHLAPRRPPSDSRCRSMPAMRYRGTASRRRPQVLDRVRSTPSPPCGTRPLTRRRSSPSTSRPSPLPEPRSRSIPDTYARWTGLRRAGRFPRAALVHDGRHLELRFGDAGARTVEIARWTPAGRTSTRRGHGCSPSFRRGAMGRLEHWDGARPKDGMAPSSGDQRSELVTRRCAACRRASRAGRARTSCSFPGRRTGSPPAPRRAR
jgi:hypothetical protein